MYPGILNKYIVADIISSWININYACYDVFYNAYKFLIPNYDIHIAYRLPDTILTCVSVYFPSSQQYHAIIYTDNNARVGMANCL